MIKELLSLLAFIDGNVKCKDMIKEVIDVFRGLVQRIDPEIIFEADLASMINVKIDTVTRDKTFVYVEEPKNGNFNMVRRTRESQALTLNLYFCRFEPFQNTSYEGDTAFSDASNTVPRTTILDGIEHGLVYPFLYLLKYSPYVQRFPDAFQQITLLYPESRFDANEVSVGLQFRLQVDVCLEDFWQLTYTPIREFILRHHSTDVSKAKFLVQHSELQVEGDERTLITCDVNVNGIPEGLVAKENLPLLKYQNGELRLFSYNVNENVFEVAYEVIYKDGAWVNLTPQLNCNIPILLNKIDEVASEGSWDLNFFYMKSDSFINPPQKHPLF